MAEVAMQGPSGAGLVAHVDDSDLDAVAALRWHVLKVKGSKTLYARAAMAGRRQVFMHRLVMDARPGQEVDHIDGDGLNNYRSNLRFVTHRENLRAAARLPGRYGNPTIEELDRELEEWLARTSAEQTE